MKKIVLFVSAITALITSCSKVEDSFTKDSYVQMSVVAEQEETKTFLSAVEGGYSSNWSKGDNIQVIEFSNDKLIQNVTSSDLPSDCSNASFTVSLQAKSNTSLKYYAVYPSSSYGVGGSSGSEFYRLDLPTEQTFSRGSFGSGSDLLISSPMTDALSAQPGQVSLRFKRIGSTAHMILTGLTEGEQIQYIEVSNSSNYIAGFSKYNPITAEWLGTYNGGSSKSIKLVPSTDYITTGADDVWFRLYANVLETDLIIKVKTNQATYNRTVNLAELEKTISFSEAGLTVFTVNITERKANPKDGYRIVTSVDDLVAGDKVLFVYCNSEKGEYYVNSAQVSGKDFLPSVLADNNDGLLSSADANPFTLSNSNSNWILTSTIGDLGPTAVKKLYEGEPTSGTQVVTWNISIDTETHYATVSSTTSSYGSIMYNATNPRFSVYATAFSGSAPIYLGKYDDGKKPSDLAATNGNVLIGKSLDISSLVQSSSTGALSFSVKTAPSDAVYVLNGEAFVPTTPGEYVLEVVQVADATYKSSKVNVVVTATDREWMLNSISIITPPSKTTYEAGAVFDPAGMVVKAYYTAVDDADYSKYVDVTESCTFTTDPLTEGLSSIVITYNGKTASQSITVTEAASWLLMGINVTTPPTKTTYLVNDSFDPTGMVVTATYSDENEIYEDKYVDVTSKCTFSPTVMSADTKSVTISFETETTTQVVTVSSNVTYSVDFESATTAYTDWTFNNMTSKQTTITAKTGSYIGTTGGQKAASITTAAKIASPVSISFYVSKSTTNTTSSNWKVQVSSNGTSWTDVKTQSATSMTKGTWVEVSQSLSTYSDVYVRVYYSGSTAMRCIDDLVLTAKN